MSKCKIVYHGSGLRTAELLADVQEERDKLREKLEISNAQMDELREELEDMGDQLEEMEKERDRLRASRDEVTASVHDRVQLGGVCWDCGRAGATPTAYVGGPPGRGYVDRPMWACPCGRTWEVSTMDVDAWIKAAHRLPWINYLGDP